MLKNNQIAVGGVKIARLYDASLIGETAQSFFPAFSWEDFRRYKDWLRPPHFDAETGHVPLPVQTFVVEAHGKIILIDTGIGNHKDRPAVAAMHMLTTRYLDRLTELGVHPSAVDYILFTHLHPDHVGWNTLLFGGRWVPTFPNARYVISRNEYESLTIEVTAAPSAIVRNAFEDSVRPVVDAGQAEFVEEFHELLDVFKFRPAPGHTRGHVWIELRSRGETAVFAGDVLHSPLQIPLWTLSSKYCADPEAAGRSRKALLEFCVSENAVLIPGHFEAPHAARIRHFKGTFLPDFDD